MLPGSVGQYVKNISPNCQTCGVKEDTDHILMACPLFGAQRDELVQKLNTISFQNISTFTLLNPPKEVRQKVWNILNQFITDIDYHKRI